MGRVKLEYVMGIDLAGSPKRRTGICILNIKNNEVITKNLYSTKDIINEVIKTKPSVIAIDAPLSLPAGRKSLGVRYKKGPHFRQCDLELRAMKIRFFPITLGPMRKLTSRGIMLKKKLEAYGFKVIETFPGAVQDILGMPRKKKGKTNTEKQLKKALAKLVKGIKQNPSHDELDGITCAWLAKLYIEGKSMALGNKTEGLLYVPKIITRNKLK